MAPIGAAAQELTVAGFARVRSADRTAWYAEQCRRDVEVTKGPMRARLVAAVGEDKAADWISRNEARLVVVEQGHLRPGHLRGQKPPE